MKIAILQNLNKLVFQIEKDQKISSRVVFGVDVLANERTLADQEAMRNIRADYDMMGARRFSQGDELLIDNKN